MNKYIIPVFDPFSNITVFILDLGFIWKLEIGNYIKTPRLTARGFNILSFLNLIPNSIPSCG